MIEPHTIDLNLLTVFQEVYRERQISSAARRLGLSQSAVSNALARLRRNVGDELFVRTASGMQPTPLATQMAEPIGVALAQVALALSQKSRFDPATSTRQFTLAMTDVGEIYFMPPLVERCRQLAPQVAIRSVRVPVASLRTQMETGHVDLAIGPFDEASDALYQRQLFRQRFVALMRKDHPLLAGELTLERFVQAEHILVEAAADGPYERVNQLLARAGVGVGTRFRVPHFAALPYIVSTTSLVVTVPHKLAERTAPPFGLAWVAPPLELPVLQTSVYWHRRFAQDAGNQWLRQLLAEVFAE